jgi:hypothetical protein
MMAKGGHCHLIHNLCGGKAVCYPMVKQALQTGCIALLTLAFLFQPVWAAGEFVGEQIKTPPHHTAAQPTSGHNTHERLGHALVSVMPYPNHPEAKLVLTFLSGVLNNPAHQVDPKLFQPFVPTATLAELFFFTGVTKDTSYLGVMMKRAPMMGGGASGSSSTPGNLSPAEQQRQLACYQALMKYVNSSNIDHLRTLKTVPGQFTLTELFMLAGFFAKAGPQEDADFWAARLEQRAAQIPQEMGEPAKTKPAPPRSSAAAAGTSSLYGGHLSPTPAPATGTAPDDDTLPEAVANQESLTASPHAEAEAVDPPQALVVPEDLLKELEQHPTNTTTPAVPPSSDPATASRSRQKTTQDVVQQGLRYLTGRHGVAKNPLLAFQHFQQAAALGSGPGVLLLGVCYDEGIGTAKNPALAFRHYLEAERRGEKLPELFFNLANMAAQGRGTPKNLSMARTYYQKAIAVRPAYTKALFNLALLEHLAQDYPAAFQHYLQGAKLGHTPSAVNLATLYANGQGTPQNLVRAYFWSGVGTRSRDPKVSALAQQKCQTYRTYLTTEQLTALDQLLKQPRSYKSF